MVQDLQAISPADSGLCCIVEAKLDIVVKLSVGKYGKVVEESSGHNEV